MKKHLFSLAFLAVAITTLAAERPVAKMRQAAVKTLNSTKTECVLSRPTLEVYSDGARFSIVSRDDRFPEVLAYGVGHFDIEQAPDNVKWWFERIQRSMEVAINENVPLRHSNKTYAPIEPMVETKWGQGVPFNNYAPTVNGQKTLTGCIATVMAQIMNYQRYPESVSFEGSYYTGNTQHTENVSTVYSWPYKVAYGVYLPEADAQAVNMSYTPLQGNNVAKLLRDCGYATDMNYAPEASGTMTYLAGAAFVEKFGYPRESVKYLIRTYYSDDEWMDILYAELANNSPVLYAGGSQQSGGHAFVVHGMDAEGLVFVNWGWQGQCDGYYAIDLLNPEGEDFSEEEEMVIGIRPEALEMDAAQSCLVTESPYEFSYDNATKELTLMFTEFLYNSSCFDFTGRLCLVIEDMIEPDNSLVLDLIEEGTVLGPFWGFSSWMSKGEFIFDPGTYRIYFATLDTDEENWQYVRTVGGAIYYDLSVNAAGVVTLADTPTYVTSETESDPTSIHEMQQSSDESSTAIRYYDLQGHEVNASAKGLLIMKQGSTVKKVVK